MFNSVIFPKLILRISLAFVFIWFGISKLIEPTYWLNAWIPLSFLNFLNSATGTSSHQLVFFNGIFEVLVGASLLTGVLIRSFAILASIFLVSAILFHGFNEVMVRDVGILGGLLFLALAPKNKRM